MKKLSELVNLKNQLDLMSTKKLQEISNQELSKVTRLVNLENYDTLLDQAQINIQNSLTNFELELEKLKNTIKQEITVLERPWFEESYRLYEEEHLNPADFILNLRKHNIPNLELFQGRLSRYIDWHHSAMIIRPGLENFISNMVALDPLYLVDLTHDYLKPTLSRFNTKYQNRLRVYTIKEELDQDILGQIPNDQFSLCFVYNYFNFRPFEILKKYLNEIYQKLTPGGVLIMTFNDCDRSSAVKLAEQYYSCYTPGYLVRELAMSVGYEIEYSWNDDGPSTWMELKKPGILDSLKGGQTLAKILPK